MNAPENSPAETPRLRLETRAVPLGWTGFLLLLVGPALLFELGLLRPLAEKLLPALPERQAVWVLLVLTVAALAGLRSLLGPKKGVPVLLYDDRMALPAGGPRGGHAWVRYEEVLWVDLRGTGEHKSVALETRRGLFDFPQGFFTVRGAVEQFFGELTARVAARPGGLAQLSGMRERLQKGQEALARRPWASQGLFLLVAALFAVEWLGGALDDPLGLVRLGANAPALVRQGQLYRLFAANFLHGGLLHVGLNALALLSLGSMVERLLGRWRFLIIYLVSAFLGSLASVAWERAPLSVGASTGLFGLFGGLAVLHLRRGVDLPAGFRQPPRWWVWMGAINAALLLVPQVDAAAHVGGFAAGALLCWALSRGERAFEPGLFARRRWVVLACAAVLVFGLALIQAAVKGLSPSRQDRVLVLEDLFAKAASNPAGSNDLAWGVAVDPGAETDELRLAERGAARAVEAVPDSAMFQDTLATVLYRLGRPTEAVRWEMAALRANEELPEARVDASQLARFLVARKEAGADTVPTAHWTARAREGGRTLQVVADSGTEGLELFVVARLAEKNLGLFWLRAPAASGPAYELRSNEGAEWENWPEEVRLEVLWVGDLPGGEEVAEPRWRFWPTAPEVAGLP